MPNRLIKESICTSDSIEALSDFHEAFFYRLIVNCDDYGRADARPAILKARLYPLRESVSVKDIQQALEALVSVDCVRLYEVEGKPYLFLPSWEKHQQIRAKKSKYPEPDFFRNHMISDDIKCHRNPIQSNTNPIQYESESEKNYSTVMSAYLNKINPTPSQNSIDELKGYVEVMGPDVCLRAIDIALDARKATWNYIRAILRNKQSQGVRCLADWDELEKQRNEKMGKGVNADAENKTGSNDGKQFEEWL